MDGVPLDGDRLGVRRLRVRVLEPALLRKGKRGAAWVLGRFSRPSRGNYQPYVSIRSFSPIIQAAPIGNYLLKKRH